MIQVIERFHRILRRVAAGDSEPVKLKDLAAAAEISPQACANIVRTMVELGYLEPAGERMGYRPGMMLWSLAGTDVPRRQMVSIAGEELERLSAELNELLVFTADIGGQRVELVKVESRSNIRVVGDPSHTGSLFLYATGIAILAHYPRERIHDYWKRLDGPHNLLAAATCNAFIDALAPIRSSGYFVNEPESDDRDYDGYAALGIPVFRQGEIVAALGAKLPLFRFLDERRRQVIDRLKQTAATISRRLTE